MNRIRTVAMAVALGVVAAGVLPVAARAANATAKPRFATDGRWITDRSGRRLVLRGVDMMGAEYTATSAALPYDASDFRKIRDTGATVVRLPIAWAHIEPAPGRYDAAAVDRVRQIVADADAAGLLVVLDMHQWHWSPCYGGNGMPEWATNPCPHVTWDQSNSAVEAPAETLFWQSHDLQQAFAAAWAQVARAVGHPDNLLGYDLLNEPPLGTIPPAVFENAVLKPFYQLVAARLRAEDPGALIFVEPAISAFAHRFTMVDLGIDRAVYTPHLYGDSFNDAGYHAGDFAGPSQFKPDLALGEQEASNIGAAFWPGEWGYLDPSQQVSYQPVQYAEDMLAAQDQAMVGSAYWTYSRSDPSWRQPIVGVLTRPSVFAVAGTPTAMTSDEHHLHLEWTAGRGTTRISLPAGFSASITSITTTGPVDVTRVDGGWLDASARPGAVVSITLAA